MPTSTSVLWNAMLSSLPRDEWLDIQTIYYAVETEIDLKLDDFEPSSEGSDDPTWHRNIRNTLQRRKASEILWGHRGNYYFPTKLGDRDSLVAGERELRSHWWREVVQTGNPEQLPPDELRRIGIYRGAQGIWVDKARTAQLSGDGNGVAVGLLHTSSQYPDVLAEDALIYHFPDTRRSGSRDENEILATKNAATNQIPVFVIIRPSPSATVRTLHLAWIENWDDKARGFLVSFGEKPPIPKERSRAHERPFELISARARPTTSPTARSSQSRFRFEVVKRYGARCVVCDMDVLKILDAVHICPDSAGGTSDPRNGLVMCANHHRAFDAKLFAFRPDSHQIVVCDSSTSAGNLGLTVKDLNHLKSLPHMEAIQWHWASSPGNSAIDE